MKKLSTFLLLGILLHAAAGHAEFVSADLRVNGLSCPFCAFGIEKKLFDVDGVRDIQVFLDEGRIAITFARENEATVFALEKAVAKAGFELAALRLVVRGRLDDGGALLVTHAQMRFRLIEQHDKSVQPVSSTTLDRFGDTVEEGEEMIVTGAVGDRDAAEPTLMVDSVGAGMP